MAQPEHEEPDFDGGPPPHIPPDDTLLVSHYQMDVGIFPPPWMATFGKPCLRLVTMGVMFRDVELPGDHHRMDQFVFHAVPLIKHLAAGIFHGVSHFNLPVAQEDPVRNPWPNGVTGDLMMVRRADLAGTRLWLPVPVYDVRLEKVVSMILTDPKKDAYVAIDFEGHWSREMAAGNLIHHLQQIFLPGALAQAFGNEMRDCAELLKNSAELGPLLPVNVPSNVVNPGA
jgi:hypothetical protein